MIKLLVETKGSFQLHDLAHRGQMIQARRPSVVENSHFIQDRIGRGQVSILGELQEEASDEDFAQYWRDAKNKDGERDRQFAIDAFMSEFGREAVEKPAPRPKKARQQKQAEPETSADPADEDPKSEDAS